MKYESQMHEFPKKVNPEENAAFSGTVNSLVSYYENLGFRIDHIFAGEYTLMRDLRFNRVRLYENGDIWETNHFTGGYIKHKANKGIDGKRPSMK
jgi:hypothetical protein